MAQVLGQIGTPLQLAALALMLLAGLARLLVRSGKVNVSAAMGRMIVNRVFALALAALVLGLASPVIAALIGPSDATYYGAVRSTTGAAVPGATVELLTIGQAPTNSMGQFDLIVPHNRVLPEYQVQVSAPGYKTSAVMVRTAAQMRSLAIELEPQPRAMVKDLEQPLLLGQFFGSPFVIATLRVENPAPSIVVISDIRATLAGPGRTLTLSPAAWTIVGQWGPYGPINGPIPIFAGAQIDLRVMLTVPSNMNQLFAQMAALPEYHTARPCQGPANTPLPPLTSDGYALYKAFATERFAWTEGEWRFHLEVVGDGQVRTFDQTAPVSAADVAGLRESLGLARNCMGINFQAPVAQDGQVANFVVK